MAGPPPPPPPELRISDNETYFVNHSFTNIHPSAVVGFPPEHRDYKPGTKHFGAYVPKSAQIGAFCSVDGGRLEPTRLGENVVLLKGVHIGHDCQIGNDTEIAPHTCVGGHVNIGRGVKIGMGAVIRNRVRIGDGAVIGCGAVVTKDVSPHTVVVGNPARFHKMAYELHVVPGPEPTDMEMWSEQFERGRAH